MSCGVHGFPIERRQNGHIDKRGAPTKYVCDKGWFHLKGSGLESRQKQVKCILTACGGMMQHLDFAYRMEKNTKSWHANRWMLKQKSIKACRPEGSLFKAQANEMQDFTRPTSVQREKHKILFQPHPMTILKSLHNPAVKAFPNTIFFQRCCPSVGRSSACPSSSDVPMQNPASPTFRRQGCNIRSELPYCLEAYDRPRFQSSVVRQHLYFVVPPM